MREVTCILIVDGAPHSLRTYTHLLEEAGYQVHEAGTGQEGLRLAQETRPDLILLDTALPDIDDIEVCRSIKAEPALESSFVVVVSGSGAASDDRTEGLEAEADGYLSCSIADREFLARVEAFLRIQQAERALRRERDLLNQIVEASPACITVVNREGEITFANSYAERVLGLSKDELTRRTYNDPAWRITAYDGNSFPEEELPFRQVMDTGQPVQDVRHAIEWPDGRRKLLSVDGTPLFDDSGQVERVVFVIEDVTERKRMERMLEERQLYLEGVLSAAPDAIVTLDTEHRVVEWNQGAERLFGYSSEEALGRGLDQLVATPDPEMFDQAAEFTRQVLAGDPVPPTETVRYRKDGTPVNVILAGAPIQVEDELVGVVTVYTDITRRKQTEEALRFERNLLYSLLDHIPDSIYFKDDANRFLRVSKSKAEHLGVEREDIVGRTDFDFYPRAQAERMAADDRQVMQDEEPIVGKVEKVTRPDGSDRWVSVTKVPRYDEVGDVVGTMGISRDITNLREMEEELRQQERLAALGQLAGGIAHDFNNILASITLYAQLSLRRDELPPRARRALETILEEATRATDLVNQILDFSRSAMMDVGPVDLLSFSREVVSALHRMLPESIRLHLKAEQAKYTVEADPTRLRQMVLNLATNARDAMPQGGDLRVELERIELEPDEEPPVADMRPGEWICMAVSDTGTGMTEEVRSHLFEPFFTTKEPGAGTGLGLPQVYGIVKQHEGAIDVETTVGEGTTFRIYLPVYKRKGEAKMELEETAAPSSREGEVILLVEDAKGLREAMREALETLGYRVLSATDGQEALEISRSAESLDLVITDLVMPRMGGEELLQMLKEERPGLKFLAITGYVMDTDPQELREAGFAGIVHKPFDGDHLAAEIRNLLDR